VPVSCKTPVKAADVNRVPWSVLKISWANRSPGEPNMPGRSLASGPGSLRTHGAGTGSSNSSGQHRAENPGNRVQELLLPHSDLSQFSDGLITLQSLQSHLGLKVRLEFVSSSSALAPPGCVNAHILRRRPITEAHFIPHRWNGDSWLAWLPDGCPPAISHWLDLASERFSLRSSGRQHRSNMKDFTRTPKRSPEIHYRRISMIEKTTLAQVATYAGVSIATASRCFSNPNIVKKETLERILEAALALNYKAPYVLERDRSMLKIAVFTRMFSNQGDMERLRGISNALRAWPHEMLLYDVGDSMSSFGYIKKIVATGRIDGLIIIGIPLVEEIALYIQKFQVPTVLIDIDDERFSRVVTSDIKGAQIVADYFNEGDRNRILFIGERPTSLNSATGFRLKAFRDRLNRPEKGIVGELLLDISSPSIESDIRDFLMSKDRPNGVFASSDVLALEVMKVCSDLGLKIPADVAVIGYGDFDLAQRIGMTTIRQHLDASGRRAVEILRSIEDFPAIIFEELTPEFVLRNTAQ
jgi:DNA-binding LacI/PurR family transcriptional regulator